MACVPVGGEDDAAALSGHVGQDVPKVATCGGVHGSS